jgi:hypothetical protein
LNRRGLGFSVASDLQMAKKKAQSEELFFADLFGATEALPDS